MRDRIEVVEKKHPDLSVRKQCKLLDVARSSLDYEPVAESAEDLRIKRLLDEIYLIDPCLGPRRLKTILSREHGLHVNRRRLQRLRREMGRLPQWSSPKLSRWRKKHRPSFIVPGADWWSLSKPAAQQRNPLHDYFSYCPNPEG